MKRILGIVFILGAMMMCLTSCGAKDFNGKWSCKEAEVDTYGGYLNGAYDTIEKNGGVSMLCEITIEDDDLTKYSENLTEFTIVSTEQHGDTMYVTLKGSYGIESYATIEYDEDDDEITVYHDNNEYTLERADFMHQVVYAIPWWVYLILGGALVVIIAGKIIGAKNRNTPDQPPQFAPRPNNGAPQFAPRPMQAPGQPVQPAQPVQPQQQQNLYVQQPRQNVPPQQSAPTGGYDPNNPFSNPNL